MRKDWVDIVKGIGISLVVIGHTRFSGGIVGEWITSFHMPLFFIIAGFCFDESRYPEYKAYAVRKVQALAFPYFTLSLFVIAMMSLLYFGEDPRFSTLTLFKNMLTGGTIGAFWFICVLLQVELLFALIVKWFSQKRAQVLVCVCCFCIATALKGMHLPYLFDIVLLSVPFYGLGYYIKRLEATQVFNKILPLGVLAAGCFGVHLMTLLFISPGKTTYVGNQYSNSLSFLLMAIVGTLTIIFVSRFFDLITNTRWRWLKKYACFLGKNSIVLLATHNALGLCQSSWGIGGGIGLLLELILLAIFLYLFSGPLKSFISLHLASKGGK